MHFLTYLPLYFRPAQTNINPFIFDPCLAELCYCVPYPDKPNKPFFVNIYPNPSKGLFYIYIPDYKVPVIMKISDASEKLLETHHLMYWGLMNWRLGSGIYQIDILLNEIEKYYNRVSIITLCK